MFSPRPSAQVFNNTRSAEFTQRTDDRQHRIRDLGFCSMHLRAPEFLLNLLRDFECAYPRVIHEWIFRHAGHCVLFLFRILFRRMYVENITTVEYGGKIRGHFPMARGVREGCPASGFLFTVAFDPLRSQPVHSLHHVFTPMIFCGRSTFSSDAHACHRFCFPHSRRGYGYESQLQKVLLRST